MRQRSATAWFSRGRLAGLLCSLVLAAAACGGSEMAPGPATTSAPSGGTLTVGWGQAPDTLNPATTGARDVGPIAVNMFDTLVWLTPDNKVTPDLATKWTVSSDALRYTFTLRQGVKFHDGTPFDASAVVANVQYIVAPSTRSTIAIGLLGSCTNAVADSQYQVTLECSKPYSPLLAQLAEPYLGIQSPTAIKKYGADLGVHPTGTGPYELVNYTPGISLTLQRNPDYKWAPPAVGHNGPASLSKLVFHIATDNQARVSELQSGQSQVINKTPGVFFNTLGKSGGFKTMAVPISGMGYFAPINAGAWPTSDVAVRRAIEYAIDKKGAIQLSDNSAYPPHFGPLQKGTSGYVPSFQNAYPYDPKKAEQVLSDGGWTKTNGVWTKDGKQLTLTITVSVSGGSGNAMAQAIQGYLQKVGMIVNIQQLGLPAWLASNLQGSFSLTPLQYVAVDPDALHFWYLPGQYYNWSHFTDPRLTDLIQQAQGIPSTSARLQLYKQAQQIIMDQALELPLRENDDLVVLSNKVSNVKYSGGGFEYFYETTVSQG